MSGPAKKGTNSGRPPKGHPPSGDFFALGNKAKQSNPSLPPAKRPHVQTLEDDVVITKATKSTGSSSTSSGAGAGLFSDPIRLAQSSQSAREISKLPVQASATVVQPLEVKPSDLITAIEEALANDDSNKVDKLLSGAIKQLKGARLKVDNKLNEALSIVAVEHSSIFDTNSVIEGLISVLKRETSAVFKTKSEPATYALAAQLLMVALKDSLDWPEALARVYIEDSSNDRVWVDIPLCNKLVKNICTLFDTRATADSDNGDKMEEDSVQHRLQSFVNSLDVLPRFSLAISQSICTYLYQTMKEVLVKRAHTPSDSILRNMFKLLNTAAGLGHVRLFVVEKFEQWIQNSKMVKPVQDLLYTVAYNCHHHSKEDVNILETLVDVKLKTRLFTQQYILCVKEFIKSHDSNIKVVTRRVLYNELMQSVKSSNNQQLLIMIIQTWPEESAKILAAVFQEFLARKEEFIRPLRTLLRDLVRSLRNEYFPFVMLARGLMQKRDEPQFMSLEQSRKERIALNIADLITCCSMLTANMLIREAYNGYIKGERSMVETLKEFFNTLGLIQRDAIWWIHSVLPTFLRPQPSDYKACLRKVLFLEPFESYSGIDNWPNEADRAVILQLMTECTLHNDTLMRVLVIGHDPDLPLQQADALDIADKLVARAANVHTLDIPRVPCIERQELFTAVLDITAYHPPSNIKLPSSYTPPKLAISKLYWKGWVLLLVLAAFNPKTVGAVGWNDYPTLRAMMEMVMTNNYNFPTSMTVIDSVQDTVDTEHKLSDEEKSLILEYENYLASSDKSDKITESNSFLLNQVTILNPNGKARKLLTSVVDLIKAVNKSLKLGQLLCRCRDPDFLLDIIHHQGTSQAMTWLKELVEGSHSSLDILPVSCICEFLFSSYQDRFGSSMDHAEGHRGQYKRKPRGKEKLLQQQQQLVHRLRALMSDSTSSQEILIYFCTKLADTKQSTRDIALQCQCDVLSESSGDSNTAWLLTTIPSLPHFKEISSHIMDLVVKACNSETSSSLLAAYLLFISQYVASEDLFTITNRLSKVLSRRYPILRDILIVNSTFKNLLHLYRRVAECSVNSVVSDGAEGYVILKTSAIDGEVTMTSDILHGILLLLSLLHCHDDITGDALYLFNLLFPGVGVATCMTTEGDTCHMVSDDVLLDVVCGNNIELSRRLLQDVDSGILVRVVTTCGVHIDIQNIAMEKMGDKTGSSNWIEAHVIRGSKHNLETLSLHQLLPATTTSIHDKLLISPSQPSAIQHPSLDSLLCQPTLKQLIYLLYVVTVGEDSAMVQDLIKQLYKLLQNNPRELLQVNGDYLSRVLLLLVHSNPDNKGYLQQLLYSPVAMDACVNKVTNTCLSSPVKESNRLISNIRHCKSVEGYVTSIKSQHDIVYDVIELLDPQITKRSSSTIAFSNLNYLLEVLLHESNWNSLRTCISELLSSSNNIESHLLLEFIWSSLHCPSLWQGMVKKEGVIDFHLSLGLRENVVFNISPKQLKVLVKHYMNESSHHIPLLITCCHDTVMKESLMSFIGDTDPESATDPVTLLLTSKMDNILHYLIMAMSKGNNSACLLIRYIVKTFPKLFQRFLPMCGWLLRGRTHLTSQKFEDEGHLQLFNNIYHIIFMLTPGVFSMESGAWKLCIEPFMDFIKYQCVETQKSFSLISKILSLMLRAMQYNKDITVELLSPYESTLRSLGEIFPKYKETIHSLQSAINYEYLVGGLSPTTGQSVHNIEQVVPFVKKLEYGHSQSEVFQVLQDLDDSSLRSVDILHHFIPQLCRIINEKDCTCKGLAHELILRYIRQSPSHISDILPSIKTCLKSHHYSIVSETLTSISEIILLSPDDEACDLLTTLFSISLSSCFSSDKTLLQTLNALTNNSVV